MAAAPLGVVATFIFYPAGRDTKPDAARSPYSRAGATVARINGVASVLPAKGVDPDVRTGA